MKYFAWVLFICKTLIVFGQAEFDNTIYDKKVQTVQLMVNGTDDRYPIISLNAQQLKLSFDVIGTNNEYFQYTLIHCDQAWKPTNMQQSLYIKGSTFDNITDFKLNDYKSHETIKAPLSN